MRFYLKNMRFLLIFFLAAILLSCSKFEDFRNAGTSADGVLGYRAKTILNTTQVKILFVGKPKTLLNAGKALTEGKYLFINELNKGIHVFDNQQVKTPKALAFIALPACKDFFVNGNILVADNGNDLVSLDISVLDKILDTPDYFTNPPVKQDSVKYFSELSRRTDIFKFENFPLQKGVYFVCPDSINQLKSFIVEWEKVKLAKQPNCFR